MGSIYLISRGLNFGRHEARPSPPAFTHHHQQSPGHLTTIMADNTERYVSCSRSGKRRRREVSRPSQDGEDALLCYRGRPLAADHRFAPLPARTSGPNRLPRSRCFVARTRATTSPARKKAEPLPRRPVRRPKPPPPVPTLATPRPRPSWPGGRPSISRPA